MAFERAAWMGVADLVLAGVVGPVVVGGAAVVGHLGDSLPSHVALTGLTIGASALLLLGALGEQRNDAMGAGRGLLAPVPQALAAAWVVAVAAHAWDVALMPLLLAAGAALVSMHAVRRALRGDLGPLRSGEDLRRPLLVAGAVVAAAGLWGLHGSWWSVDSSWSGGYQYQYGYDSYSGGYEYGYQYNPLTYYAPGAAGGPGGSDWYVVLGGVGLLVAGFTLVRADLRGCWRWLPLVALAAPIAYLVWSARLTSGYGAMVAWDYEVPGWTYAGAGLVLAVVGLVQVRRPAVAVAVPAAAPADDPAPPF